MRAELFLTYRCGIESGYKRKYGCGRLAQYVCKRRNETMNKKIAVAGTGYVGLSIATLLSVAMFSP